MRLKNRSVFFSDGAKVRNTKFSGKSYINRDSSLINCSVGHATYIGAECYFERTIIKNYVSIGPRVKIVHGTHPINKFVSTSPVFYLKGNKVVQHISDKMNCGQDFEPFRYVDGENFVEIGHDVWIGADVRILNGVKIGDGAVIATGAVVIKDVSPFSIVGGIPAKEIKKRFDEETIEFLASFKWWDKDDAWLFKHKNLFGDVNSLKEKFENELK